jgi:putative GTP pyrophosphokinase
MITMAAPDGIIGNRTSYEEYYGESLTMLTSAYQWLMKILRDCSDQMGRGEEPGVEPIEYVNGRIKDPSSMMEKLSKNDMGLDGRTAVNMMHDVVGVRVVCSFTDNVYDAVGIIKDLIIGRGGSVIEEKDYIARPKPSGYRSYHLIVTIPGDGKIKAEIQIRTIAMDAWSSLEHQINYKRNVRDEDGSIHELLKKCADEISSSDTTMTLIKNAILRKEQ